MYFYSRCLFEQYFHEYFTKKKQNKTIITLENKKCIDRNQAQMHFSQFSFSWSDTSYLFFNKY